MLAESGRRVGAGLRQKSPIRGSAGAESAENRGFLKSDQNFDSGQRALAERRNRKTRPPHGLKVPKMEVFEKKFHTASPHNKNAFLLSPLNHARLQIAF